MNDLLEDISYDPESGLFARRSTGESAGGLTEAGYVRISIHCKRYYAHRLAWLYVHGVWPSGLIDHRNGNKADNRIDNLRVATKTVNGQNRRTASAKNKSSGVLGVSWVSRQKKWLATIVVDGRQKWLGTFDCIPDASAAYIAAKRLLHVGNTL